MSLETSPIYGEPAHDSMTCPRCGRIFERPVTLERGGEKVTIRGHVVGDPKLCVPIPGLVSRDARARKANRRGSRP